MNKFANRIVAVSTVLMAGSALAQVDYDFAQVVEVRPIVQVVEISTPSSNAGRKSIWWTDIMVAADPILLAFWER